MSRLHHPYPWFQKHLLHKLTLKQAKPMQDRILPHVLFFVVRSRCNNIWSINPPHDQMNELCYRKGDLKSSDFFQNEKKRNKKFFL